jgi:hypothetical protein
LNFFYCNIDFKKISVKNNLGEIKFSDSNFINEIEYLNLSDFKGKKIYFEYSNISFKKINIINNKSIIYFKNCNNLNKNIQKEFDLSKDLKENIDLIYYFDYETLSFYKNDFIKLYRQGLINLTKLKHLTEYKDFYNWFKNEIIKDDNNFNLFESLISFNEYIK